MKIYKTDARDKEELRLKAILAECANCVRHATYIKKIHTVTFKSPSQYLFALNAQQQTIIKKHYRG